MKHISKGPEPKVLQQYKARNPNNTWQQFRRDNNRLKPVQDQIKEDQGHLCAYCEIDLLGQTQSLQADFRVEHFHPKSDSSTSHNWALDWNNLLGCCHGGTRRDVQESSTRFTTPDTSCDVPKGDTNLDNMILNPLNLPRLPLFKFVRSNGEMHINGPACQEAGIAKAKAQATVDELRLNANRLKSLRKAALNRVNRALQKHLTDGKSLEEARQAIAQMLRPDAQGKLPKFYSSIRSYLGKAAEAVISQTNSQTP